MSKSMSQIFTIFEENEEDKLSEADFQIETER